MKNKFLILSLVLAFIVSFACGCATHPDRIGASYVSPLQFTHLNCKQIQAEMARVSAREQEAARSQRGAAAKDKWATGIGLIIFWPALLFTMGGDRRDELARLRGEYEALEKAAIQNECMFIEETREIPEE